MPNDISNIHITDSNNYRYKKVKDVLKILQDES